MSDRSIENVVTFSRQHYAFLFTVGFCSMVVAGWFLIDGLSQFSASTSMYYALVLSAIIFQLGEAGMFVTAAVLPVYYRKWRWFTIVVGSSLFILSVLVMTLAQKSAMSSGEIKANAIDEKVRLLQSQIASIDSVIQSYQTNADKQSRSVYAQSRALGQDSLNRSSALLEKKLTLSSQIFDLQSKRNLTSGDFFSSVEKVTGFDGQTTELVYLVARSALLEFLGVSLMTLAAYFKPRAKTLTPGPGQGIVDSRILSDSPAVLGSTAEPRLPGSAQLESKLSASSPGGPPAVVEASVEKPVYPSPGPFPAVRRKSNAADPSPVVSAERSSVAKRGKSFADTVVPFGKKSANSPASREPAKKPELSVSDLAEKVILAKQSGDIDKLTRDSVKAFLSIGSKKARDVLAEVKTMQEQRKSDVTET